MYACLGEAITRRDVLSVTISTPRIRYMITIAVFMPGIRPRLKFVDFVQENMAKLILKQTYCHSPSHMSMSSEAQLTYENIQASYK